jgi:hypothetical protein
MIVLGLRRPATRVAIEPLKRVARELKAQYGLPFDRFLGDLVAHNPGSAAFLRLGRSTGGE